MNFATVCVADLLQKIKDVGEFGSEDREKVFYVYSEDDLMDRTRAMRYPAVGLMYEGIISHEGDPTRQGMAADLTVALALVMDGNTAGMDQKNEACRLLDLTRQAIRLTRAPTGHIWRFVSEVPMGKLGKTMVYVQRWATMVALTS